MLHNKWLRKITALIHVGKKEPVMITAKVGTFKRKQQMRDFLDHLPKDNHDDIFTATPFQNRRVKVNLGELHTYWWFLVRVSRLCSNSASSVPATNPFLCFWERRFLYWTPYWRTVGMRGAWLVLLSGAAEGNECCQPAARGLTLSAAVMLLFWGMLLRSLGCGNGDTWQEVLLSLPSAHLRFQSSFLSMLSVCGSSVTL